MQLPHRQGLIALPLASMLVLALATGAAAQVATLRTPDPDAEPSPAAVEAELDILDREDALLAYAQCMRDNGINMDDPTAGERGAPGRLIRGGAPGAAGRPGAGGFDEFGEDFGVAQQACGAILEAARADVDPAAEQERLEGQLQLAQCIRDGGYPEYPDPMIGTDGRLERVGGQDFQALGIDRRSEAFRETMTTCRDEIGLEQLLPGGGPGLGRGGN